MKRFYTKILLAVAFACCLHSLNAQTSTQKMTDIPDIYTHSIDSLALYIDCHQTDEEAKLKMLYTWMTSHLRYNVYPTFISVNKKRDERQEMLQALTNREGVCRHFALIFQAVSEQMDIPAFFIEGYTKTNGVVTPEPHAWCAALVNGQWYQYDPTFGMGYVRNYQFVSAPNPDYCQVSPEVFIRTHMPFDPIWQFLPHPYSYRAFDQGKDLPAPTTDGAPCDFADSIRIYLRQKPVQRLTAVNERIRQNGPGNRLVDYYLQLNTSNIAVHRQNEVYEIYKKSLKYYNRSVDNYNEIVRYRRVHSKIKKEDRKQIKSWTMEAQEAIEAAQKTIDSAQQVPEQYETAINNLKNAIDDTAGKIKRLNN